MKGVLICGGLGTRLHPLTKTMNKQLLPVYNQPLFYYPLKTLTSAGITEIMIVSAPAHAGQFMEQIADNKEFKDIHIEFVIQQNPVAGIADALNHARVFAGEEKIAVLLGDNIFEDDLREEIKSFEEQESGCRLFFKEVPDPERFGCPEFDDRGVVCKIIEKPKNPPSKFCVTGLYLYDNRCWDFIDQLKPSERGQLEITELNNFYVYGRSATYHQLKGEWIDAGTFDSLLKANLFVARKNGIDLERIMNS